MQSNPLIAILGVIFYAYILGKIADRNKRREHAEQPLPPEVKIAHYEPHQELPETHSAQEQEADGPVISRKKLHYRVNGRGIPCGFERYYYVKLGMALPITRIERDMVERYYRRRISELAMTSGNPKDIKAAYEFFNDRLDYMEQLN